MIRRSVIALYLFQIAGFCLIIAYYRLQATGGLLAVLPTGKGLPLLSMFLLCAGALTALLIEVRRAGNRSRRPLVFAATMTTITLLLVLSAGEVLVRLAVHHTAEGDYVRDTILLPRVWQRVAESRRKDWEQWSGRHGVLVLDEGLGWSIGSDREGKGPLGERYFSSKEGFRTGMRNVELSDHRAPLRIALVGDSYTFCQDVNHEDSWGYHLEQQLGGTAQVLNFGVPGYGIDQAYLRYLREVKIWRPHVVILAFISHDVLRTTMVYYAISFPSSRLPGAKPRFVLQGDRLILLNRPLPSFETVAGAGSVWDLPFVEYDHGYRRSDWIARWYRFSYLIRFLVSWNLPWKFGRTDPLDPEAERLGREILRSFVREVVAAGSIPLIVFFPEYQEFGQGAGSLIEGSQSGLQVLRGAGLEYHDLTPCVATVPEAERFGIGWHFTGTASAAIAECLRPIVRNRLDAGDISR
jgi:hypothetical protein